MKVGPFLFSFKGRIGRGDFWLLMLTIVAMVTIAVIVVHFMPIGFIRTLIGFSFFVSSLVVFFAAVARRLHDRNKSAWYVLLFFGLPTALQSAHHSADGKIHVHLFSGGFNSFLDVVCLAISIWMIVELGVLRGTVGANQYGADPAEPLQLTPCNE